jgi:exonuclease SbcC
MSINIQAAMATVRSHLQFVEQVDEFVVRGVKRRGDAPYALFYVDLSGAIVERAANLSQYQDRVLGKYYFNASNSGLRWNSYMILLADKDDFSNEAVARARIDLERDRSYARKFVVAQEELGARLDSGLLTTPPFAPESNKQSDALGRWSEILESVGLQDVLSDVPIASVVRRLIDRPANRSVQRQVGSLPLDANLAGRFIDHLELVQFRKFPSIRQFDCKAVNLVRGVNGVGKTTLLEAIEFLLCGDTRRGGVPKASRVVARFAGVAEAVDTSNTTPQQVFRNRNLTWYGKRDVNRNNMVDSFAVYNFLNTDAAVDLAASEDPLKLEADLATLLLGPEAARIWSRIEQLTRDLPAERRGLEKQRDGLRSQITTSNDRIAAAASVARSSDEIFSQLCADLLALRWRRTPDTKNDAIKLLASSVADLEAAVRRVVDLPGLPHKRTKPALEEAKSQNTKWLVGMDRLIAEGAALAKQRNSIKGELERLTRLKDELDLLTKYSAAGFSEAMSRNNELRVDTATLRKRLGEWGPQFLEQKAEPWPSIPISLWYDELRTQVSNHAALLASATNALEAFKMQQSKVEALRSELRSAARELLTLLGPSDSCPLCQTVFSADTLEDHLFGTAERNGKTTEAELSEALKSARKGHEEVSAKLNDAERLSTYASRSGWKSSLSVLEIARYVEADFARLENLRKDQVDISSRLAAMNNDGLTLSEYESVVRSVRGKLGDEFTSPSLSQQVNEAARQLLFNGEQLATTEKQIEELRSLALSLRNEAAPESEGPLRAVREAVAQRVTEIAAAEALFPSLRQVLAVDEEESLRDVHIGLVSASGSLERLRLAIQSESMADTSSREAEVALATAQKGLLEIEASVERVKAAEGALEMIRANHSREIVSRELLDACRADVARIFERIHSPHEFQVSAGPIAPLERIENHEPIDLNKVSSGQRAAFAVSLFLALNSRAPGAPAVVLIDDPVAHVDDLNTLSFLDYLRDIAVAGNRQIFFATADDKLASLFAHKFSFMGSGFNNIALSR